MPPDDSVAGCAGSRSFVLPVGIALALSRGGMVALAVGVGVVLLWQWWPRRTPAIPGDRRWAVTAAAIVVSVSVVGFAAIAALGSAGVGLRPGDVLSGDAPQATLSPVEPGTGDPGAPPADPTNGSDTDRSDTDLRRGR